VDVKTLGTTMKERSSLVGTLKYRSFYEKRVNEFVKTSENIKNATARVAPHLFCGKEISPMNMNVALMRANLFTVP
jgi:hypothetical protein